MLSCLTARTVKIPLKWLNSGRQLGQYNRNTTFLISKIKLTRLLLRYILQIKLCVVEEALQMAQIYPYQNQLLYLLQLRLHYYPFQLLIGSKSKSLKIYYRLNIWRHTVIIRSGGSKQAQLRIVTIQVYIKTVLRTPIALRI